MRAQTRRCWRWSLRSEGAAGVPGEHRLPPVRVPRRCRRHWPSHRCARGCDPTGGQPVHQPGEAPAPSSACAARPSSTSADAAKALASSARSLLSHRPCRCRSAGRESPPEPCCISGPTDGETGRNPPACQCTAPRWTVVQRVTRSPTEQQRPRSPADTPLGVGVPGVGLFGSCARRANGLAAAGGVPADPRITSPGIGVRYSCVVDK